MLTRQTRLLVPAAVAVLVGGVARAGTSIDLNEVGALLVYSSVQASDAGDGDDDVETFVTITNAKGDATTVHMSFINGDSSSNKYCYECDFDVPMSGYDTEMLVLTANGVWTDLQNDDAHYGAGSSQNGQFSARTCQWSEGMLVAWAEEAPGDPDSDNRLFGDEIVVNYTDGYAYSLPAHSLQNDTGDPTERSFDFGAGYASFPRVVATNFLAPTTTDTPGAELVLFTLDFKRQHPPAVDCSVMGYDANENAFSNSIAFGCWERIDLCQDLDPEFCYPNLGLDAGGDPHTHGWLSLNCEVDHDAGDGQSSWSDGNVHGAVIQRAAGGTVLRKNDQVAVGASRPSAWTRLFEAFSQGGGHPVTVERTDTGTAQGTNDVGAHGLANSAAWARLLFQSVSQGDPSALTLGSPAAGPGPLD